MQIIRSATVAVSLACTLAAVAQAPRATNPEQGIQIARASDPPKLVLFWFTSDEGRGERQEGNHIDREREAVRRALNDKGVQALANQGFVIVQGNAKKDGKWMQELGVDRLQVAICDPEKTFVKKLSHQDSKAAAKIIAVMEDGLKTHGKTIFKRKFQPALQNPAAKPNEIRATLNWLNQNLVEGADEDVAALLDREKLDGGVRAAAHALLSKYSTETAAKALLDDAVTNPAAEAALKKCKISAAPVLMANLSASPDAKSQVAYRSLAAICGAHAKAGEFWKTADEAARSAEIERIRSIAEKKLRAK